VLFYLILFKAEDGIRDFHVTGVQTCALPIFAAHATDIVPPEFDGDGVAPDALERLDFSQTLAFENFTPSFNAMEYEHSDIDVTRSEERCVGKVRKAQRSTWHNHITDTPRYSK